MKRKVSGKISLICVLFAAAVIGCAPTEAVKPGAADNSASKEPEHELSGAQTVAAALELEPDNSPKLGPGAYKPAAMKKGINIGNALEAPKGISWDVEMKAEFFDYINQAGFDTVRLPVRFSDYTIGEAFTLEEEFMEGVDYYIDYALNLELNLILDLHHFEDIMQKPNEERRKLISIWEQLGERYKDYPQKLIFEVLNEPKENLHGELLNSIINDAVYAIRKTNPDRLIIIGPESFNSVEGLENLSLPKDDNIIVTFHYYVPNDFAFQGNIFHPGYENLHSITWTGTDEQMERLREDFLKVSKWAEERGVKVLLGEFGIVNTVPIEYRTAWIEAVTDLAEELGFSWCYWELCSHFGIFDCETNEWDAEVLRVLID